MVVNLSIKKAFAIFDTDNSGTITPDELVAILTRDTPAGKSLTKAQAEEIVHDFDSNGDGVLDLEEFSRCWAVIGAGASVDALENHSLYAGALNVPGVKPAIKQVFDAMDVSGDGVLDVDELETVISLYHGTAFNEDEFFGYWDVMGAHEDHVGTHHAEDHKSGDIELQEFGWYVADCAGLADYKDGNLDGMNDDAKKKKVLSTLGDIKAALDVVHERQKRNKHPLHLESGLRDKYQDTLKGHRMMVGKLFTSLDKDASGSLDFDELRDVLKGVVGRASFNENDFMKFFEAKSAGDVINKTEFGWYIAHLAAQTYNKPNDGVTALIEKFHDVRVTVQG